MLFVVCYRLYQCFRLLLDKFLLYVTGYISALGCHQTCCFCMLQAISVLQAAIRHVVCCMLQAISVLQAAIRQVFVECYRLYQCFRLPSDMLFLYVTGYISDSGCHQTCCLYVTGYISASGCHQTCCLLYVTCYISTWGCHQTSCFCMLQAISVLQAAIRHVVCCMLQAISVLQAAIRQVFVVCYRLYQCFRLLLDKFLLYVTGYISASGCHQTCCFCMLQAISVLQAAIRHVVVCCMLQAISVLQAAIRHVVCCMLQAISVLQTAIRHVVCCMLQAISVLQTAIRHVVVCCMLQAISVIQAAIRHVVCCMLQAISVLQTAIRHVVCCMLQAISVLQTASRHVVCCMLQAISVLQAAIRHVVCCMLQAISVLQAAIRHVPSHQSNLLARLKFQQGQHERDIGLITQALKVKRYHLCVWNTNAAHFSCDMGKYSPRPMNKIFAWRLTPYFLNECYILPYSTEMNTICLSVEFDQGIDRFLGLTDCL